MGRYNFCHCVYMIPLYCLLKSYQYYNTFNNVWYDFQIDYIPCLSDCNCRQPSNWRYQNISLASLKWVIINGFSGTSDAESLLCSIMKNAKGLSEVSIASSTGFNPCIWKVSAQAPWAIYSKLHLRLLIPIKNLAIHCKSMKEVKHLVGGSQTNEKATMKHQRN